MRNCRDAAVMLHQYGAIAVGNSRLKQMKGQITSRLPAGDVLTYLPRRSAGRLASATGLGLKNRPAYSPTV